MIVLLQHFEEFLVELFVRLCICESTLSNPVEEAKVGRLVLLSCCFSERDYMSIAL